MMDLNESVYLTESEELVVTKIGNYYGENRPDLIINFCTDHQPNDEKLQSQHLITDGINFGLRYIVKTSNPLIITSINR